MTTLFRSSSRASAKEQKICCVTVFIFWIGIYPQTFLSRMEPTVKAYLTQIHQKYQAGVQMEEGNKIKLAQTERK